MDRGSAQDTGTSPLRVLLGSVCAAWGVAVADVLVLLLSNAQISGMLRFVARAGIAAFTYTTLVGFAYGLVALLIAQRHRRHERWLLWVTSPALLLALPWIAVAAGLGQGPGISGSKWQLPVVGTLALAGVVGLIAAQWLYLRARRQAPGRARWFLTACFVLPAGVAYASGFLYPNSYHSAHAYMLLLTLVSLHAAYLIGCGGAPLCSLRKQVAVVVLAIGFVVLGLAVPLDHTSRSLAFRDAQLVRQVIFHRSRLQPVDGADDLVRYDYSPGIDYGARPLAPCPDQGGNDYDVILISVDSLRADRLAVTQPERSVVPNIDRLAQRSLVYHSAYSPSPSTSTSLVPLIAGSSAVALRESGEVSSTLATELRRLGYETITYQPFGSVARRVFPGTSPKKLGFEVAAKAKSADAFASAVISKIQEKPERPFFIYHHLLEPHITYSKHSGFDFGDKTVDKYDSEVAYVDHHIGRIVDAVHAAGRSEQTIIAITADHAEAFYEHGLMAHGTSLYDEMVRVPLVIAGPGIKAQTRSERVSLIDVAPTLLAINGCGWSLPQEGRPLWANGSLQKPTQPVLVIQYNEHDRGSSFVRRIATFAGDMKLIEDLQSGSKELYSMTDDPEEKRNLASQNPDELNEAQDQRYEAGRRLGWFVRHSSQATDTPLGASLRVGKKGAVEAAYSRIIDKPKSSEASHLVRLLGEVDDPSATDTLRLLLGREKLPAALQRLATRSLSNRDPISTESLLDLAESDDVSEHARAEALAIATESIPAPPENKLHELSQSKSPLVAGAAAVALCERVGGAATSELIRTRFKNPDFLKKLPVETVRTLIKCVGEAPSDEDIYYLLAIYATAVAKTKHSVYLIIEALGRAKNDSSLVALRQMARSTWEPIRVEAVKSIINLDSPGAAAEMAKFAATHQNSDVEPTRVRALLRKHSAKTVEVSEGMPASMNWELGKISPGQALLIAKLQDFSPGNRLVALHLRKSAKSDGTGQCSIALGGEPLQIDISSLTPGEDRTVYFDPEAHTVSQLQVRCEGTPADRGMDIASAEILQMSAR